MQKHIFTHVIEHTLGSIDHTCLEWWTHKDSIVVMWLESNTHSYDHMPRSLSTRLRLPKTFLFTRFCHFHIPQTCITVRAMKRHNLESSANIFNCHRHFISYTFVSNMATSLGTFTYSVLSGWPTLQCRGCSHLWDNSESPNNLVACL